MYTSGRLSPPLEGIRVLDLSRLLPGPMCSWYLRGLGAAVVKVEHPVQGDYLRFVPPFGAQGMGAWFEVINAGCRSVALDLKDERDRDAARCLIANSDVVIDGFRPGVMARLGLDPAELIQQHPGLIIASITGFGQTGTHRQQPGHDLQYVAMAGGLSLTAAADGLPPVPGLQVADIAGGALTAALRITAALLRRFRNGQGEWIDVSMTEGVLPLMVPALAQASSSGKNPAPSQEPLTGGSPFYRVYACGDGRPVAVAAIEPQFRQALTAALEVDDDAGQQEIAAAFLRRSRAEWLPLLDVACVSPVLPAVEVLQSELHRARGAIVDTAHVGPRVVPPGCGDPSWVSDAAPSLGEHTVEVLSEVGFSRGHTS